MIIKKEIFYSVISAVKSASNRKDAVYSNAMITTGNNKLKILASDGTAEIEISTHYEGDAERFCVNLEKLDSVLKNAPDNSDVVIDNAEKLTVKYGRSRFKLEKMSADDFPLMPVAAGDEYVIDGTELAKAIRTIEYAVADNDVRHYLNGAFFDIVQNRIVATDGHRLAYCGIKIDRPKVNTKEGFILPKKTIRKLSVLQSTEIKLTSSANLATFTSGNVRVTAMLIDGKYPNYAAIVPTNLQYVAVNLGELKSAINRVSSITTDKFSGAMLSFSKGELEIKSNNNLNESAVDCIAFDDGGSNIVFEVGINHHYLSDAINSIDDDIIQIGITGDNNRPILIPASGGNDCHVIMPMRI